MEQYNYADELISKWTASGHLSGVREQDMTRVAQRLEAAFRRTLGSRGEPDAVGREIVRLQHEGYVPRAPENRQYNDRRKGRR